MNDYSKKLIDRVGVHTHSDQLQAVPVYTNRSQYLSGLNCPQMRALSYHSDGEGGWRGVGVSPAKRPDYFELGTTLHKALEAVAVGVDPIEVQREIWKFTELSDTLDFGATSNLDPKLSVREGATFIEAVMWCWLEVRLPNILAEYDIERVEEGIEVPLGEVGCSCFHTNGSTDECNLCANTRYRPLIWQSKPDLILRRKRDSSLFVLDIKSSGSRESDADIEIKLQHSTLIQAQMAAVEHEYGEPCIGFLYEGIYKGYRERKLNKHLGYKRQVSPLIYAYCTDFEDGLSNCATSHDNWRTGPPKLLADLPHSSIKDYVAQLPEEVKEAQFMTPQAIGLDPRKVARWREQVLAEEQVWVNPQGPFSQNDEHCFRYGVNRCCSYKSACYTEAVRSDLLGSGQYVERVPHHTPKVAK